MLPGLGSGVPPSKKSKGEAEEAAMRVLIARRAGKHTCQGRTVSAPSWVITVMPALSARLAKHARGRAPAAVTTVALRLVAVTDVCTGTAHRVTDEAMVTGRRAGGRYAAVCGVDVLPASLTVPERRFCHDCAALTRRPDDRTGPADAARHPVRYRSGTALPLSTGNTSVVRVIGGGDDR